MRPGAFIRSASSFLNLLTSFMDKKNTVLGVLFLGAAFVALQLTPKPVPPPPPPPAVVTSGSTISSAPAATTPSTTAAASATIPTSASIFDPVATAATAATATVTTLANDYIEVRFTNLGGAIQNVALKKYPAVQGKPEPFVFNGVAADPMLAVVDFPGIDRNAPFNLVSQSPTEIVYRLVLGGNLEITRRYVLAPNEGKTTDPYQLRHETTFRNLSATAVPARLVGITLGTIGPANQLDTGAYTTTGYSNADDQEFIMRASLDSSHGFLGLSIGAHGARPPITTMEPMTWTTVKNQFFAAILAPDAPAAGLVSGRVRLRDPLPTENENNAYGISGVTQFQLNGIEPQAEAKLGMDFYVGPKEYRRLENRDVFKAGQDKVMEFGFFKFFSQLLATLMTWLHDLFTDRDSRFQWGVAIILTTLVLKIVTLPLTLKASKSMKRMQKLAPEMKLISEKFKDNPQKRQVAMMELYKQHRVNPVGGCIPLLLPMPFFFGFYTMLQSTAELRFAPFLWAPDLSVPDTVGHIFGFPINILPLLLGVTMVVQMQLTPQVNMDKAQAMMMKFTPVIFLAFCYNFSCALALYSTVNGLFTIGQQMLINRMKDEVVPAPVANDRAKNVTPAKKRR